MGRTTQNAVSIYIGDDLLLSVDRLAAALGKSRASTIKWVLSEFKDGMDSVSETLEQVEGRKRVPVAAFLRLMAEASALIGQKQFDLAMEHEHARND